MSADLDADAVNNFNWTVGLTVGVGLLALAFTLTSFEMLIRRITGLTAVVDGFTRGDYSIFDKGIDRKDELSQMARAIYRFKQDTLEMMRNAKKLEEEQKASNQAQDLVVEELRRGLADLSNGDLTVRFTSEFPADYEDVRKDFNNTIAQLRDALGEVAEASGSIDTGAVEINQAAEDQSARTSSQAATLEQTAAALEQLTASVRSAAEGARTVENTTEDARHAAASSGAVVRQAVTAMSEIEQSATQIAQITSVIDDIAFQTNLLALNAGVEAARSGEAGRGFAVVASEVRALAQRSSDAAIEIKTLIGSSSQHVEQGVELVNSAGEALESILQRVMHISGLVSEIAEGAQEQSVGLAEINTGVVQLDGVTQQNVAMVENATASSQMLKSNAQQLSNTIGKFTLTDAAVSQWQNEDNGLRRAGLSVINSPERGGNSALGLIILVCEARNWRGLKRQLDPFALPIYGQIAALFCRRVSSCLFRVPILQRLCWPFCLLLLRLTKVRKTLSCRLWNGRPTPALFYRGKGLPVKFCELPLQPKPLTLKWKFAFCPGNARWLWPAMWMRCMPISLVTTVPMKRGFCLLLPLGPVSLVLQSLCPAR